MKKTTLLIAAACMMAAAVSCQKEQAVEKESAMGSKGILTVTADISKFGNATKTSIIGSASTPQPVWSEGDEIKLFNTAGESAVYVVDEGVGESSATFTPKSSGLSGTFACAYYPAENATSYTEGTGITATIPATQAYTAAVSGDTGTNAGTFAAGSFPMVGTGTIDESKGNLNLTFKNVFGLLQLNFTGSETIKQIDLIGSANLSGTATISTDGEGTPTCGFSSGQKYVTLTGVNQALNESNPTAFYIAVPAGTISKIYVTTSASLQYSGVKSIEITRSNITSKNSATLSSAGFSAVTYSEASSLVPAVICGMVWAPVNCGYDASHTYGLLYQFGRKVGGGYDSTEGMQEATAASDSYDSDGYNKNPGDAKFYTLATPQESYPFDWYTNNSDYQLSAWPMKSGVSGYVEGKIANPCPTGWRVPTYDELNALTGNNGEASIGANGWDSINKGYWFNGTASPKSGVGLFLPAAGYRNPFTGESIDRESEGFYWSSSVNNNNGSRLCLGSGIAEVSTGFRAIGNSVRCVQE